MPDARALSLTTDDDVTLAGEETGDGPPVVPGHPLAVSERWAQAIPGARLLVEGPDEAPLAWPGAQVSRAIADVASASA